jgi:hypothetical protein
VALHREADRGQSLCHLVQVLRGAGFRFAQEGLQGLLVFTLAQVLWHVHYVEQRDVGAHPFGNGRDIGENSLG